MTFNRKRLEEIAKPRSDEEIRQAEKRKRLRMLKRKDKEPLHEWVERMCKAMQLSEENTKMVHEIAKEAYVVGSDVMFDTLKRYI